MPSKLLDNVAKVRLVAQDEPVAAIASRFCERDGLALKEKPISGMFTRSRAFVNASTDALRFTVKKKLFGGDVLLDPMQTVVANVHRKTFSSKPVLYVHSGKKHEKRAALFEIAALYASGTRTDAQVTFKDITTGEQCHVSFEGNWEDRNGLFWLRKGHSERLEAVAKVYWLENKTRVEIARNFDAALIVLIMHILADRQDDYENNLVGGIGGGDM